MDDPLVLLMRRSECQVLLDRLRKRIERGEPLSGICRLSRLSIEQRRVLREVTGVAARGKTVAVDLAAFDHLVRSTGRFHSLHELVERAVGEKIANRRAERSSHHGAWSEVWSRAVVRAGDSEALNECLSQLRRSGWLSRAARRDPAIARELLEKSFDLLERLPSEAKPLSVFAAEQTGDAHALDPSRTLGRLLARLIAAREGIPRAGNSAARRRLWEAVGIVPDELSASVLVMNLPAVGDSLCDQMLRQHRSAGAPCRLTFRHLRLHRPTIPSAGAGSKTQVFVCENPSVLAAAADRLGSRCPPLVCVEGQPNLTCLRLLRMLSASGFGLKYHGDFDWGGIRIANRLFDQFGFEPWRYTAVDHRCDSNSHRKLKPPAAEAAWDAALAGVIAASGIAVEEESLIDDLIGDLREAAQQAQPDR